MHLSYRASGTSPRMVKILMRLAGSKISTTALVVSRLPFLTLYELTPLTALTLLTPLTKFLFLSVLLWRFQKIMPCLARRLGGQWLIRDSSLPP